MKEVSNNNSNEIIIPEEAYQYIQDEQIFTYPEYDDKPIIPDDAWEILQEQQEEIYIYEETQENIEQQKRMEDAIKQAKIEEEERREKELDEYYSNLEHKPDIPIPEIDREQEIARAIEEAHFRATHEIDRMAMLIQRLENPDQEPIPIYKKIPDPVKDIPEPIEDHIEQVPVVDAPPDIKEDITHEEWLESQLDKLFTKEEEPIEETKPDIVAVEVAPVEEVAPVVDDNIVDVDIFNFTYDNNRKMNITKRCYKSDGLITENDNTNRAVETISKNFKDKWIGWGNPWSERDEIFCNELPRVVFGTPKDDKLTIIPRICGGGKSVILAEIINYQIEEIKKGNSCNGMIIISDKKKSLKDTIDRIPEQNQKYTYLVESGNKELCINNDIKNRVDNDNIYKYCWSCKNHETCKIQRQEEEQYKVPILFITTARADLIGEDIERYEKWANGLRTTLFIDEKPILIKTKLLARKDINNINSFVSEMQFRDNLEDKNKMLGYLEEIRTKIINIMDTSRGKMVRKVIRNYSKTLTNNDNEFQELWDKYFNKFLFKDELDTIKEVLTGEAYYINTKKVDYVAIAYHRNLKEQCRHFRTFVLDATSLIDPQYECISDTSNYLYLPNDETFENLSINFLANYNISKTKINNSENKKDKTNEVVDIINNYLNSLVFDLIEEGSIYTLTYKDIAKRINIKQEYQKYFVLESDTKLVDTIAYDDKGNEIKVKQEEEYKFPYHFNYTKGFNDMKDAIRMIQFGYNRYSDYQTLLNYMATLSDKTKANIMYSLFDIEDEDKREENIKQFDNMSYRIDRNIKDYSKADDKEANKNRRWYYKSKEDYLEKTANIKRRFGFDGLNRFEYLTLATDLFQEVFRTALRKHDKSIHITVVLFGYDEVIDEMLKQMFPSCKVNFIKELPTAFIKTRDGSLSDRILNYINGLKVGTIFKTKDLLNALNITDKQLTNAVGHNIKLKEWLNNHRISKGKYKV